MEIVGKYRSALSRLLTVMAGTFFVYLSIYVIGLGAAVAIPASILTPMAQLSPTMALSLTELITIGIPVALCFALFAWLCNLTINTVNYYLLAAPFVVFMVHGLSNAGIASDSFLFYSALTIGKLIPVLLVVFVLSKPVNRENNA